MRRLIRVAPAEAVPARAQILARLGIGDEDPVSPRLDELIRQADDIFRLAAAPAAVFHRVSHDEFASVYDGSGWNSPSSPLEEIYPRAEALALFAATLGRAIDEAIRSRFGQGDPALGYLLDVTASSAADRLAELAAERFLDPFRERQPLLRALSYSPGYCGWHITGQQALFERLKPDEIGLELTSGYLMAPLKSVSGVLVAGRAAVHRFRPTYPFCDVCTTHECRVRMAALKT